MRSLFLVAMLVVAVCPAEAAMLKANNPGCVSEDLLKQFNTAMFDHDLDAIEYLVSNGCAVSSADLKASVLDVSSWGTMLRIRAYRGKNAVEVWVFRNAVEGYDPLKP